jgi:hypothetical protein
VNGAGRSRIGAGSAPSLAEPARAGGSEDDRAAAHRNGAYFFVVGVLAVPVVAGVLVGGAIWV